VWFADGAGGIAGRVDDTLATGTPSEEIPIPPDPRGFLSAYFSFAGLAVGDGQIWVAGDARGRTVWRLDPATGRVIAAIPLPFVPGAIATGAGGVWVASLLDDTISRIDPTTNRIVATVRAGRGVRGVAVGEGAVWTANSFDGTVSRIDPRTNRVVATVPVAGTPLQVAAAGGGIWVTTAESADPRPKGTIDIGVLSDCEGMFASAYNDSIAPAELPLIQRGGVRAGAITDGVRGVAIGGRPVHLVFGCGDGTTVGALAEARRLVEQAEVDVLIGPLGGNEGLALQEYARRHPTIAFVNGSSSSQQLHSAPNFFSFWYDGAQWMAGVGAYAYHELGWRTAATVTNADDFDWAQTAAFVAEFCSLGGKIAKRIWLPQGAKDFSGIVDQVPPTVDGLLVEAQGTGPLLTLARGVPWLKGNLGRKVVAGTTTQFSPKLGARQHGVVWGGPTQNPRDSYLSLSARRSRRSRKTSSRSPLPMRTTAR
jgi:YVTN family beta-propeller protein